MGNCLVLQGNLIKIMKTDGRILEYRAPMKVEQVLSEFSNHALSDRIPVLQHLQPDTKLIGGQLYYLVPVPLQPPEVQKQKKKVRFANQEVEKGQQTGVMRVKLVISKKELEEMIQKGGVSVEDTILQNLSEHVNRDVNFNRGGDCRERNPILESIPEVD